MNTNIPSTEERVWAVLSHLSAVALGMGILLPIVGWSEQRRKSNYAAFQCLQALGYQSLGYTIWILSYLLLIIAFLVVMVISSKIFGTSGNNLNTFMGIWTSILLAITFGAMGLYLIIPVFAAVACALGKEFHYPFMGRRLASYLEYDATKKADDQTRLNENREDRWVVAMGHISVIIAVWGMLAPLTAWMLQGKRSFFLKFQSVQTLIYQIFVTLLFLGAGAIYVFGFFLLVVITGFGENAALNSSTGMGGLVVLFGSMLTGTVIVLIVPLFHIMGQWAGYRVLKGDDYHYPVFGNLVEKRMSKSGDEENLK
jgi:uncharacterized Tic20 family protein